MSKKKTRFLFHVANVFFDAGELEECMETLLESYRLGNPLFFAPVFHIVHYNTVNRDLNTNWTPAATGHFRNLYLMTFREPQIRAP